MAQGFTPLPVVPQQDATRYPLRRNGAVVRNAQGNPKPLFNGKNPSYFDSSGEPRCITDWRDAEATPDNLKRWFSDPQVTALGVVNKPQGGRLWVDLDRKRFPSDATFEEAVAAARPHALISEITPGGWHGLIAFTECPLYGQGQLNIGWGNVPHAGEIPAFVVVAPSVRADGSEYRRLSENPDAEPVANLEALGFYAHSETKTPQVISQAPEPTPLPEPPRPTQVRLLDLASKKIQARIEIALGGGFEGDGSREIVAIANELYGWERLAVDQGITCDSADTLIQKVAEALELEGKLDRCLKLIKRPEPALADQKGRDTCIQRLELKAGIKKLQAKKMLSDADTIFLAPDDLPGPIAHKYLFSEGYVRIEDSFYLYVGTHYEKQDHRHIKTLISGLFERCVQQVETKNGNIVELRPYRASAKVRDAYEWALTRIPYIPLDEVNPPGVNCVNGVLTFDFNSDGIPQPKLLEHSPEMVFINPPQVAYHPEADDTHALRLLEAISPSYRNTVLRVSASAIDLGAVRKVRGRSVRSLIFTGSGANGKDALREAVTYIFGKSGLTSCTIDDFHAYDQGRRFNLASLAGSRINWASENRVGVNIDGIQSLKQMVSGDPLVTEEKFKQGQEFTPRCISIFSTNDRSINLTASLEAIASRYAIVPFIKTFVPNPTKANELQADPRFKYDPQWVKDEVCPALLNILIQQYQAIFTEGIDYEPFNEAMEKNRLEVNHLWRFAVDTGLEEDPDGQVTTNQIWEKLRIWYEEEGILRIDSSNRENWEDDVRAGDPWVRGSQQLKKRLSKLFPNIESYRNKAERGIVGLRFVDPVEKVLISCNTWGDYCRIVELHGKAAIDETWHKLSIETQNKIAALQPGVTTPEPTTTEPEPLPDELTEADIQEAVAMLSQAVEGNTPELLESFRAFPKAAQKRILNACPLDVQAGVQELKKRLQTRTP